MTASTGAASARPPVSVPRTFPIAAPATSRRLRGWPGPGGGRCSYLQPPREWRGTTAQVCGLWPYSVGAGAPLIGAPLGRHLFSGATVCGDPISWFQHAGFIPAPTSFVLAREGFGKSTVVRRMATGCAYFGAIPLVLGDLKPDYPDLIHALGGEVIPLGRGRGYLNPLDMSVTHDAVALLDSGAGHLDGGERAKLRSELLSDARGRRLAMISALATLQRHGPLSDHEDTILGVALAVLDEHHPGEPVLGDLIELLEAAPDRVRDAAYDQGSLERYHELTAPLIRTLRGLLYEGRIGEMFSRKTSRRMDLDHPAVFDVSSIPEDQSELVAAALTTCWGVGFSAVHTRAALGQAGVLPMRHYLVILDELWRVLSAGHAGMVDRVNSLTRLNRQWGTGLVMITHTDQGPPVGRARARAAQGARVHRALGHADLRRAPTRGAQTSARYQGILRRGAAPDHLLAGPPALGRNHHRRASRPRQVPDQGRRPARHPLPRHPDRNRAPPRDPRHLQALAPRTPATTTR